MYSLALGRRLRPLVPARVVETVSASIQTCINTALHEAGTVSARWLSSRTIVQPAPLPMLYHVSGLQHLQV